MAKRFLTLLIIASLLGGTSGLSAAGQRDFETRGTIDYLPRVVVFAIHPVGVLLNTFILRPIGHVACSVPELTGCGPDEQRALGMEGTYQDIPSEPAQ
ncbi:MAG TPA: hypothetical protein VJK02_13580 [Anaerolineales bacterium]|nr:hypothetical protein [Anaerolineales bacterium]